MKEILVAYFSASGVTAGVAKTLAKAAGSDLYEADLTACIKSFKI